MQFFFLALCNAYPTFVIAIFMIGACTAVIGDVAGHLGCFINLKDGVNAIAFVALGTSVPGPQDVHDVDFSWLLMYCRWQLCSYPAMVHS